LSQTGLKKCVYTGNIGEGQGLEKIVPAIAKAHKDIEFHIIGAGGRRGALEKNSESMDNVKLFDPVSRDEIIERYEEADVLFLHLNNYPAFQKVLPSKIFEYVATFKPIIAGVDGYARQFLNKYVSDCLVFDPCDVNDFSRQYVEFKGVVDVVKRRAFIQRFSRRAVMTQMADHVLTVKANHG
jgi:hypothetical protein